jgi:hypothetical protein
MSRSEEEGELTPVQIMTLWFVSLIQSSDTVKAAE